MGDILERMRSLSLRLFPASMRDGHNYHEVATLLDRGAAEIDELRARVRELEDALTNTKADREDM